MPNSSLWITGVALFAVGFLLVAGLIFGHGGWAKSAQFRVIGELVRGVHGRRAQMLLALGLVILPMGACLTFAGVTTSDRERAQRCNTQCTAEGYASARIGPNSDRDPNDRRTWFVACICEEPGMAPREFRAR
jgi:hypothetical protein